MLHGWWAGFYAGAVVAMVVLVAFYAFDMHRVRLRALQVRDAHANAVANAYSSGGYVQLPVAAWRALGKAVHNL